MTAELPNVELARRLRFNLAVALGSALVGVIGFTMGGDSFLVWIGPYLVAFHTSYAWGVPWLLGSIRTQKVLVVDDAGLHQGRKHFVPWECVAGAKRKQHLIRRETVVLAAPEWPMRGFEAWSVRRLGLPLSDFDRKWRANANLIEVLRRHLPPAARATLRL